MLARAYQQNRKLLEAIVANMRFQQAKIVERAPAWGALD
jgi:hypothetical protein